MSDVADLELETQENAHPDLRSIFQGAVNLALERCWKRWSAR